MSDNTALVILATLAVAVLISLFGFATWRDIEVARARAPASLVQP